jgi:predicted ATPase
VGELSDWTRERRLVRAFRPTAESAGFPSVTWPATVPAAAQLLRDGLELAPGITILVGENGSGKSTVVEMMAEAYGLNPQGGSILAPAVRVRETEPGAGGRLLVERGAGSRSAWAYFLRADTMHSLYT